MERKGNDPARDAAFQEGLDRIQGIRESEVPYPAGYDLGINPNQGRVLDESSPSTHPLAKVVLKKVGIRTPEEIAETADPATGNLAIDPVVFRSVSNMDWGA